MASSDLSADTRAAGGYKPNRNSLRLSESNGEHEYTCVGDSGSDPRMRFTIIQPGVVDHGGYSSATGSAATAPPRHTQTSRVPGRGSLETPRGIDAAARGGSPYSGRDLGRDIGTSTVPVGCSIEKIHDSQWSFPG